MRNFLCRKKIEMPFSIIEFLRLPGATFDPCPASLLNLAKLHERAFHKLHFHIKSVYVSVAEKKLRPVLFGQLGAAKIHENSRFWRAVK